MCNRLGTVLFKNFPPFPSRTANSDSQQCWVLFHRLSTADASHVARCTVPLCYAPSHSVMQLDVRCSSSAILSILKLLHSSYHFFSVRTLSPGRWNLLKSHHRETMCNSHNTCPPRYISTEGPSSREFHLKHVFPLCSFLRTVLTPSGRGTRHELLSMAETKGEPGDAGPGEPGRTNGEHAPPAGPSSTVWVNYR